MRRFLDATHDETAQAIMAALLACYGSLEEPHFGKICETLKGGSYRGVIESLRNRGIEVTDTSDYNDDVSLRLILDRAGDQVGLALSGVGPFAAVLHQDAEERYSWVTQPDDAPTPLAAEAARTAQQAGFRLLDRSVVSQWIAMSRYDGSTEVTLFQALFSDRDRVP